MAISQITASGVATDTLTAADIADDAIGASELDFQNLYFENATTTQNLTGTYSTERMYLNDSYTLTGNVTVSGHLSLSTLADANILITNDSTARTITGSGVLEAGKIYSKIPNLTDMTGELGNVVTGSPNLNLTTGTLGSGVTFPAGHVLGVEVYERGPTIQNNTVKYVTCLFDSITVKSSTSKILIMIQATVGTQTAGSCKAILKVTEDSGNGSGLGNTGTTTDDYIFCTLGGSLAPSGHGQQSDIVFYHLHDHNADVGGTLRYKVWFKSSVSNEYVYFNNYAGSDGSEKSSMVLMEIAT